MILRILMVAAAAVAAVMAVTPARAGKASEMEMRISPKDLIHIPAFVHLTKKQWRGGDESEAGKRREEEKKVGMV